MARLAPASQAFVGETSSEDDSDTGSFMLGNMVVDAQEEEARLLQQRAAARPPVEVGQAAVGAPHGCPGMRGPPAVVT